MTDKSKEEQGPGNQPVQAGSLKERSASPSKGKVGDQVDVASGTPEPSVSTEPLFTTAESAQLLQVELPFHDSSPNYAVVRALEAVAAARLNLFTQVDQALQDAKIAKG